MGELAKSSLIFVVGSPKEKLAPKFLRQAFLEANRSLMVDAHIIAEKTQRLSELIMRRPLHPDQQAACAVGAGPVLDVFVQLFPSAKVKVTNAEIPTLGKHESLL